MFIKVTPLHHSHLENFTKLFLNKQVCLNAITLKCVGFILVFGKWMDGWMDGQTHTFIQTHIHVQVDI